jgi:integrase
MARPIRHGSGWRLRWLDEKGERKSETVHTTFDDACFLLRKREQEAEEIARGLRAPLPPTKTFNDLCDYYLAHCTAEKRRKRDDETIIRAHLRPAFGLLKLQEVHSQVDSFKLQRRHLSKKTLHNHLTLLITMLRVAHEKNWLATLPRIKKPKLRLFDKDFHYLRTDEEIRRFLIAARQEEEYAYFLYAFAIYTGMREGELAGLHWDDVQLDRRLICVQRSYDGPTKNGEARYVPILDPLLPLIREWRLKCPGRLVFPNRAGNMHQDSARVFQETFHATLDRAGFPKVERAGKTRRYIVFHDLRHTFASHWMTRGGDLFKLQKILGHKSAQMVMRYAHLNPDAYADDFGRLGAQAPGSRRPEAVVHLPQPLAPAAAANKSTSSAASARSEPTYSFCKEHQAPRRRNEWRPRC